MTRFRFRLQRAHKDFVEKRPARVNTKKKEVFLHHDKAKIAQIKDKTGKRSGTRLVCSIPIRHICLILQQPVITSFDHCKML